MKTKDKKQISILLRLFLSLAKSDGNATNKEIAKIVRYFHTKFGENTYEVIDEEIESISNNPGDISDICYEIASNYSEKELRLIFLDLLALAYIDGINSQEIDFITKVADIFGFNKDILLYFKIFTGVFKEFDNNNSVLTLGHIHSNADVPVYQTRCKVVFFFTHLHLTMVVLKADNIILNEKRIRDFYLTTLGKGDRLLIDKHIFEYHDIINMFHKKKYPPHETYLVVKKGLKIELSLIKADKNKRLSYEEKKSLDSLMELISEPNPEVMDQSFNVMSDNEVNEISNFLQKMEEDNSIARLEHLGNQVHIHIFSNENTLFIGNHEITNSFKQSPPIVFDREKISFKNLEGEILLENKRKTELHRDLITVSGLPSDYSTFDLWKYDHKLPPKCTFTVRHTDNQELLVNISNYKDKIKLNGGIIGNSFTISEADQVLVYNISISDLIIKIDLKERKVEIDKVKIFNLNVNDISYQFSNSKEEALHKISFDLNSGELGAILGPSGAGKSTLLKVLMGEYQPYTGDIHINHQLLSKNKGLSEIQDHTGFVPQDDLLFGGLSVWENLFFRYRLKYPEQSSDIKNIESNISSVLENVGLKDRMQSKVGTAEQRILSGGERKKLNIALELLGQPDILILDEPTTGLSSQDAEEIVSLLRTIADQGKIVLIVVHQPSSTIYKMFDKVVILNKGQMAFFGDRIQALMLFKDVMGDSVESSYVKCPTCEKVNPELLMKSLKFESANFWREIMLLKSSIVSKRSKELHNDPPPVPPPVNYNFLSKLIQFYYQFQRTFLCKARDKMNLWVTLCIAPLLSVLTSFLLRYQPDKKLAYSFANNEMYLTFLFLIVIVAVFLGLSNSAPEIIKDRLTLKRERLLSVPLSGYFISKFIVLFLFALIQSILFIVPAHLILNEYNMIFIHIGLMTLISSCGIAFGLLGSSFLQSSTAAYNLIPLILIPQIILGGALVKYKELNQEVFLNKNNPIPEIAQLMVSRWAYELLVTANIDLNPYNQAIKEEKKQKILIQKKYRQGQINREQKNKQRYAISKQTSNRLKTLTPTYNVSIKDTASLMKGEYLSKSNNWFNGNIRTWQRNLVLLSLYTLVLLTIGYIRLRTLKL